MNEKSLASRGFLTSGAQVLSAPCLLTALAFQAT
jgi:hypothetical protein